MTAARSTHIRLLRQKCTHHPASLRQTLADLTLAFNRPLDPGSEPAAGAFTFHHPLHEGEREALSIGIGAVSVSGKDVVLRLENAVPACASFTVSYDKDETTTPIQRIRVFTAVTQADSFSHRTVTNARASHCVARREAGNPNGRQSERKEWQMTTDPIRNRAFLSLCLAVALLFGAGAAQAEGSGRD